MKNFLKSYNIAVAIDACRSLPLADGRCLPLAAACRWPTSSLDVQRDLPSCVFGLSPVIAACHRVIAKRQNRVHTKEKVYTLKEG